MKNELKDVVEKIEAGSGKIEDFASIVAKRLKDFAGFHDEAYRFAKEVGQEETVELSRMFDGGGLEVPEQKETFAVLNRIALKSREAAEAVSKWLRLLGEERLRKVVGSKLVGDISMLEENRLKDIGEAWRLNKNIRDFDSLMKGVETALGLGEKRREQIFILLHDFVETRDEDKVAFLEKTLGWMSEVREAFKEGTQQRTRIVDRVVELAEVSKSKLDSAQMLRVSGILENLLDTHAGKDAYSLFIEYLHGHLLDYAGLGGDRVEPSLLEECLSKWEVASRTKDSHISLLRFSVSEGSVRYQANTPKEVNYIKVDKDGKETYIPIIATKIRDEEGKEARIIPVPRDAQEYLKRIGYLPKDTGLILFTETKPGNAKTIMPVTVEEGGKIALTEWLERFLHKDAEYREKYLIDTGRGYVLNWEQLDKDHMVLIVMAIKDGQVCERRILLRPHEQDIVRTRVEEIANPKDIVICEFKMESWQGKILSVEEAKDVFRNQFWIEDEKLINDLAERLHVVMHLSELDLERTDLNTDSKGRLTEFLAFLTAPDKVEKYQVRFETSLGSLVTDFVLKDKYIVEAKYRSGEIKEEDLEDILTQLAKYNEMITSGETKGKTLILFFLGLSDVELELLTKVITNELGNMDGWMTIAKNVAELKSLLRS